MKKPDDETPRNSGLYIGSEPLETVHDRSAAKLDDDDDSKIGDSGDDDSSDSDTTDSDTTDSDTTDSDTTDKGDDSKDADGKD